jgi:hypothetical protein
MTYRYRVLEFPSRLDEDALNRYAQQGLEFCSETQFRLTGDTCWRYIFRGVVFPMLYDG